MEILQNILSLYVCWCVHGQSFVFLCLTHSLSLSLSDSLAISLALSVYPLCITFSLYPPHFLPSLCLTLWNPRHSLSLSAYLSLSLYACQSLSLSFFLCESPISLSLSLWISLHFYVFVFVSLISIKLFFNLNFRKSRIADLCKFYFTHFFLRESNVRFFSWLLNIQPALFYFLGSKCSFINIEPYAKAFFRSQLQFIATDLNRLLIPINRNQPNFLCSVFHQEMDQYCSPRLPIFCYK